MSYLREFPEANMQDFLYGSNHEAPRLFVRGGKYDQPHRWIDPAKGVSRARPDVWEKVRRHQHRRHRPDCGGHRYLTHRLKQVRGAHHCAQRLISTAWSVAALPVTDSKKPEGSGRGARRTIRAPASFFGGVRDPSDNAGDCRAGVSTNDPPCTSS